LKIISEETRKRMSEAAKRRCDAAWRMAKSEAYGTHLDEGRVREMYGRGLTQAEIAEVLGVGQKAVFNFMRRKGIKARIAAKRNQFGPLNAQWKGDAASYKAFHRRLVSRFGQPSHCEVCGTSDPARHYDWANLTGHYEDLSDYKRMCRSCHWVYDKKELNLRNAGY
jgi:predicted transcriptional regulator